MSLIFKGFPLQKLPYSKKNKDWRKQHLDWSDKQVYFYDNSIRKSFIRKRINQNLINGVIDLEDMNMILNPDNVDASYIPENIQHYPILNSKLNVLRGEEYKRRFDFKLIVTNPNAISEKEKDKSDQLFKSIQAEIESKHKDDESFNKSMDDLQYYFTYEWQDAREERGNYVLNHYMKELNMRKMFNDGFMNAMIHGEEVYQCDIFGGEPTIHIVNPMKMNVFRNGYSNRIEDADVIVMIDYWSPGKIIDYYHDVLTDKDVDYIDSMPQQYYSSSMQNIDERMGFMNVAEINGFENGLGSIIDNYSLFAQGVGSSATTNYFDNNGNIRVVRVYWKSKRKVKKIKSYNPDTGEEEFDYFPETYKANKDIGQEESVEWINEAWEGTKIGKDVYVNMRPRVVQYNRLDNPSRCHFGIVGSIYNVNESKPFSLVDIGKPYSYLYNALHDRLNKAIAANWGKILKLDLAMVPKGWEVDKWMYYAKVNHIAVVDSFKEGNFGAANGKIAGMLQQSSGVIDLEQGNYIQQHIQLLEYVKKEMSEAIGISPQREGQISSSETVGGVERSNLQSSHITEWLYMIHDDTKKRALECFLETAKIAMRGNTKKFQYILNDGAIKIMDIDGDEFADCDYGLVVDNSNESQLLEQNMTQLAHAALQNQTLSMSSIIKIFNSPSMSEIQRTIEKDEANIKESQSKAAEADRKLKESELQFDKDVRLRQLEIIESNNIRDNETKLLIANASNNDDGITEDNSTPDELFEKIRQFDEKISLERDKLNHKMSNDNVQNKLKEKDIINRNNKK